MYQSQRIAKFLSPYVNTEIVGIKTAGDNQNISLTAQGSVGIFVTALRDALSRDEVDLVVHSLKDVPTVEDDRWELCAVPERVNRSDVFVSRHGGDLLSLPAGAVVGTSSPRRAAWVLRHRPDVTVAPIRGNVDTRLRKVAEGEFDATLLAHAGLSRLGLLRPDMVVVDPTDLIPAPGQAALGIEIRGGDEATASVVSRLHNISAGFEVEAERAVLRSLNASCATAAGASATFADGTLTLIADVSTTDGADNVRVELESTVHNMSQARALGDAAAQVLLAEGADKILQETSR